MRLSLSATFIALSAITGEAFAPSSTNRGNARTDRMSVLSSSVATRPAPVEIEEPADGDKKKTSGILPLTGDEINARRDAQLQKLRMKDKTSIQIEKEVCAEFLVILLWGCTSTCGIVLIHHQCEPFYYSN